MIKLNQSILCLLLCFSFFSCSKQEVKQGPPNVILIFTDDLGYGDLSSYGNPNISTPNIDKIGSDGIRFTSFYAAAPVCTPSRAALLTGRYPIRNSPHNFGPESKTGLPETEIILPQLLKEKGYATMGIGKWHLGHLPQYLPTARGFDSFYGLPYSNDMILPWCPWLSEDDKLFLYEDNKPTREIGFNQDNLTIDYTKKAVEFIQKNKDNPFFLYFAHSMPHLPISTSEEFRGKSRAGLYGDVIQTIDWSVAEVLKTLKDTGIEDNTLVIFTSDNGPWQNLPERMLQKGVEATHSGSSGPLRGSKATTWEGGFRVPALIKWPSNIPSGQTSREVVTTMDLFTTIVNIAGGNLPSDRAIDGNNILDHLKGGKYQGDKFFYLKGKTLQAVREGKWKLRVTKIDSIQLYNLNIDPSEKFNVANENKDIVQKLQKSMEDFSNETDAVIPKIIN